MCGTCGCDQPNNLIMQQPGTRHVRLETSLLARNDAVAEQNRRYFLQHGILAINLVSGPGAGKTRLLEVTASRFCQQDDTLYVIEGDQQTSHDADRVRAAGALAHQINTGHVCHLEAIHVSRALEALQPADGSLLVIENVGNLVCPASFDLGEQLRVVIISTTEGDDKPLKYPDILVDADLLLVSKSDLAPHVDFDIDACIANARRIRPGLDALVLSSRSGEGVNEWLDWLASQRQAYAVETSSSLVTGSSERL